MVIIICEDFGKLWWDWGEGEGGGGVWVFELYDDVGVVSGD